MCKLMTPVHSLHLLFNDARMATIADALDELHSAASDGRLRQVTTLQDAELLGWLYELIYTANETMAEIRRSQAGAEAGGPHIVQSSEAC